MMKPRFNPEITWGHVIHILVACGIAVGLYADARVYKANTDYRLGRLEKNDIERDSSIRQQAIATQNLSEAVVALKVVVEERTARAPFRSPRLGEQQRN